MNSAGSLSQGPDDRELMRRIAGGDAEALGSLYDRHHGVVYGLGLRILRRQSLAEEVLGDVFWEIWNRAERFDPERGDPVAYLMTVARSRILDRRRTVVRREKLERPVSPDPEPRREPRAGDPSPFEQAMVAERRGRVRHAMQELDPGQREAVELAFFDGLSHSEIAEMLATPLGTIKSRIRKGLIRLRDHLNERYGAEVSS